ncbi:hypothetical protein GCM10007972_15770 [Iodidimonas muriae]|uniref:Uncharacterized protein n=2 Tax=Iodidimonas muriae TaxID=261467 RepID=A0ABQ2LD46_9PROT|nr:hypothetical protein JCM17843_22740 [Kordiimonadales bacterium JCM 17843]GGO11743.1 hypothetical protein GCM10007972_15770 [Iodidimonas muriae]
MAWFAKLVPFFRGRTVHHLDADGIAFGYTLPIPTLGTRIKGASLEERVVYLGSGPIKLLALGMSG